MQGRAGIGQQTGEPFLALDQRPRASSPKDPVIAISPAYHDHPAAAFAELPDTTDPAPRWPAHGYLGIDL